MPKNKIFYSVLKNKCPNCLKGNFFSYNNVYSFSKFDVMNNKCPKCGMDFRQEPGFYLGAAIVSYALQAALLFLTYLLLQVMVQLSFWYFVAAFSIELILLAPLTFRISRLVWINMLGTKPK
ncbi:MAG: DUF983 domain-containing protein [Bacteroidia bacterium]